MNSNPVKEYNREYQKSLAKSKSAIEQFNKFPTIPDEKKQILYDNISAPIFSPEMEREIFEVKKILQNKTDENEFDYYIRNFIIRLLLDFTVAVGHNCNFAHCLPPGCVSVINYYR